MNSIMTGNLGYVVVAVDGSEESMEALRWALDNVKLRPADRPGCLIILHVQSPPSIAAGVNPGPIPFGGPTDLEVPAFTAAIEAHQKRITDAILNHALGICKGKNLNYETKVVIGDPKEKICEVVENLHADLLVMGSRAFGPIKSQRNSMLILTKVWFQEEQNMKDFPWDIILHLFVSSIMLAL